MNLISGGKELFYKARTKIMSRYRLLFLIIFFTFTYSMGSTNTVLSAETRDSTATPATLGFTFMIVDGHSELLIRADRPIGEIKSFRLDSPNRLVIDVENADFPAGNVKMAIDREELKSIRIARHEGKVRFVFDLSQDKPVHHSLERSPEGVKVIVELESKEADAELPSGKEEVAKAPSQSSGPEVIPQPETPPQQAVTPSPAVKRYVGKKVSIKLYKADIRDFFSRISKAGGVAIEVAPDLQTQVTLKFTDMPWDQALDTIVKFYKLKLEKRKNGYYVSSASP